MNNLLFFIGIVLTLAACKENKKAKQLSEPNKATTDTNQDKSPRKKLQQQQNKRLAFDSIREQTKVTNELSSIKNFTAGKAFNKKYAVIINMRIPSFKKRLFVYDLNTNKVVSKALVSHGQGSVVGSDSLKFSNVPESKQSSLGKYKVGIAYYGQWGFAYRLHGLNKTNSNALMRNIVLHSYVDVPDEETDSHIVLSSGCPMVSIAYMQKLKQFINASTEPMLLSIIY